MNKSEKPTEPDKPTSDAASERFNALSIDEKLQQTMQSLHWIAKLDDETLAADEAAFNQAKATIALPESLKSADAIFSKVKERRDAALPIHDEIGKQMARAARDGGKLTSDVEERMKRDRQDAEHKHNKSKGYEDLFN
ncbi:MAG: hypothetical protein HY22_03615 [[Candidatus Thermochlorobacteriaceae] bacterium GBChlB]|nr:MAG: hypothetical protein HY22_03615 [[Candidatus Thermochlorobacteriaceae] bacterium GBChlB]